MIRVVDFVPRCDCRSAGECSHGLFAEPQALSTLARSLALQMERKMTRKWAEGWRGWDDPEMLGRLRESLVDHVARGFSASNMVDVACLAAMIWNQEQR